MKRREEATELLPSQRAMDLEAWARPLCALVVAGVAAYASYVHQREFARQGGADPVSASMWPLSVDGLLLLATVGRLKHSESVTRRARWAVRSAFLQGIAVSLAANVAAAPTLERKTGPCRRVAPGSSVALGRTAGAPSGRRSQGRRSPSGAEAGSR
ncbi:DUF2637 domain-containing protein [Streptomyces sp. NPDC057253]|uniref:DUF2637 domain-containing protein n=1 Tax=Streptomyces sp. NPDC057253 TaxID=3346069 RepID=UPI003633D7D7